MPLRVGASIPLLTTLDQDLPVFLGTTMAVHDALAAGFNLYPCLGAAERIGPGIHGIGEDLGHRVVDRKSPGDLRHLIIRWKVKMQNSEKEKVVGCCVKSRLGWSPICATDQCRLLQRSAQFHEVRQV